MWHPFTHFDVFTSSAFACLGPSHLAPALHGSAYTICATGFHQHWTIGCCWSYNTKWFMVMPVWQFTFCMSCQVVYLEIIVWMFVTNCACKVTWTGAYHINSSDKTAKILYTLRKDLTNRPTAIYQCPQSNTHQIWVHWNSGFGKPSKK